MLYGYDDHGYSNTKSSKKKKKKMNFGQQNEHCFVEQTELM